MTGLSRLALPLLLGTLAACSPDSPDARHRALPPGATLAQRMKLASPAAGERLFTQCAACHSLRPGGSDTDAPNLYGVVGQSVARHAGYPYSAALRTLAARGGHWDAATLDRWLTDPQKVAPGTVMGFAGLDDPLDRADLIAYLQHPDS